MWTALLVSAILALTSHLPAAHGAPLLLQNTNNLVLPTFNTTGATLEASSNITDLTYRPWPKLPYIIELRERDIRIQEVLLIVSHAYPCETSPAVNVNALRQLLRDFADNLKREYPYPGFVPGYATQWIVDVPSCTRWDVTLTELLVRLPTLLAVTAMQALEVLLWTYGPSEMDWGITSVGGRSPLSIGFLTSQSLGGVCMNASLADMSGDFKTA